ncbi:MAG: hypothetical protein IPJ04_09240 [Candidatus Eisenbacteria bacterium]|nr:hypothetical protein [Candidatus Eisenbacteria bacterium]
MRKSKLQLGEQATIDGDRVYNQSRILMILVVLFGALCGIAMGLGLRA